MEQRRLAAGRFQSLICPDEICVLLGGVGDVLRGGVVGHGKMLEHSRHGEAGQPADGRHLVDGLLKIGAECKPDPPHAGVGGQMHLDLASGGDGGLAHGAGLLGRIAGSGQIVFDQFRRVGGLDVAKDQDGLTDPGAAELFGLGQTADGKPCRTFLREHPGTLDGTVAVAVGLDDGAERQTADLLPDDPEIGAQGVEVDLGPDVFFKGMILHRGIPSIHLIQSRSGQADALDKVYDIVDGGQLGQAGDIDHLAAVVGNGGEDGVIGLNVTADGRDRCPVDAEVDLPGADDAVGLFQVGFRLGDEILVGGGIAPLEQHDLIVGIVAVGGRGDFQCMAEGGILGHLADRPEGAFVIDGDAVFGGVVGVGVGGGAAVDHKGQDEIRQNAEHHDDAHGHQELGAALLGGFLPVDILRHEEVSFLRF